MAGPRVLLLDEPSLGLAPRIVEQVGEVIREINRHGVTVVLVEQNASMALALADRAAVLEVGRVALEGRPTSWPQSEEVRDRYLGIARRREPRAAAAGHARDRRGRRSAASSRSTGCRCASAGIAALSEVSFRVAPGLHARADRAERRGQVDVPERALRRLRRDRRERALRRSGADAAAPAPDRRARRRRARSRTSRSRRARPCSTTCCVARHRLMRSGFLARRAAAARAPAASERSTRLGARDRGSAGPRGRARAARRTLSYGTRKRVELARALCAEPGCCCSTSPSPGWSTTSRRRWPRRSRTPAPSSGSRCCSSSTTWRS